MLLFPAIDLLGGRCVRLHQGDFSRETVYDDDPLARARQFEAGGATWIHVVDLDAARRQGGNREVVLEIAHGVSVPVQAGGGIRDEGLLAEGVERIVLGSLAVSDPRGAAELIEANPGHVSIGLDHRAGEIQIRGWERAAGVQVLEAIAWPDFAMAAAFVVTNIERDATLAGPDVEGLSAVIAATTVPVVASGGVGSLDDIRRLRDVGVAGVIVGKAIYEGRFTVEEAVAVCAP